MSVDNLKPHKRTNKSRKKGDRVEYECVHLFRDLGMPAARRVPMSGQLAYLSSEFSGDVRAGFRLSSGKEVTVQSKAKKGGWNELHKWLGDVDALYLRADKKLPLVVMNWQVFASLIAHVPAESRLPKPDDPLAELRKAAELSPYAKQCLDKIETMRQVAADREVLEEAPF